MALRRSQLLVLALLLGACSDQGRIRADAARDTVAHDLQRIETAPDAVVVDQRPTRPDRCGGGELLDLSSGSVKVQAETATLSNEFGASILCGGKAPLSGPQRYYSLDLEAGRAYRVELTPDFEASLYLVSACSIDVINADCSEEDGGGAWIERVAAGEKGTLVFWPTASGSYHLAVDSRSPEAAGSFELEVESFGAATASRCATAEDLVLNQGAVQVEGVTLGGADEFEGAIGCKTGLSFLGPQLYYALDLEAGASYRIGVSAAFEALLYVFSAAAGCEADNIELDCGGIGGTVALPGPVGAEVATRFTPPVSGRYLVAVDSLSPRYAGELTLRIEREDPLLNESCAAASVLTLVDGHASVEGDTQGLLNDRGALLQCTGRPMLGPQRYYRLDLEARPYRLRLAPAFDAVLSWGQSCQLLPVDCQSAGLTGNALFVPSGSSGELLLTPAAAMEVIVSVDSARSEAAGPFTLELVESLPPENGVCTAPAPLSVGQTLAAETGPLQNDLMGITCGSTAGPFAGPQAYFLLDLSAGQRAEVLLEPHASFDPALYAFVASTPCEAQAVNTACAALVSDTPQVGVDERLEISASVDTQFVVVVDSWSPSEVGPFTLSATLLP